MNSTDLGIYLDTLGFTGKIIRFINWLAPWSLIISGVLGIVGGYAGVLSFLFYALPIIIVTVMLDVFVLAGYFAHARWVDTFVKVIVFCGGITFLTALTLYFIFNW